MLSHPHARLPVVRKVALVGEGERRTLEVLEAALAGTPYRAFSKVRVKDVLSPEVRDRLWHGERSMLSFGHFDFLVCKRPSLHPVFVTEFDGPSHDLEPQRSRDRCKNRLCWRADLTLLRITEAEIAPHERVSILEYMLRRFIAWPNELPGIQAEIRDRTPEFDPHELAERDRLIISCHRWQSAGVSTLTPDATAWTGWARSDSGYSRDIRSLSRRSTSQVLPG